MKLNIIQSLIRRGLSFVFLSLLMPLGVGAQTNYDLWIGDIQVTSENASNIQADNLTAGTAVFDASTNTLTLTGATIGYGGVQSGLENLTIVFNGTNTIESYIGANSEVAGTHNLTLQSGSEGSTMYLDNTIGKSIIDGFDNLSLDGLYVSSESPLAYNATAKQYRSVQFSGIVIQEATITTVPHYALWVGYVQVSDENKSDLFPNDQSLAGKVSFNSTNNTLSLQDVNLEYNVLNHLSNLTISVSGDCKIGSGDSATAVRNTYPNGTLTLKSTGDGNQLAFNNSRSVRDFSSIELTGLNWDDNYSYESAIVTEQQVEYVGMHLLKSDGTEAAKAVATTGTPYPLWVAGIRVTSINASNITGVGVLEGEVAFDGVNTLNLTSANLDGPIQTSLANLIVEIVGPCILSVNQYAFIANESTSKITFATKDPENSSITVSYVQSAPFSGFVDGNIIFTNDLEGKIVSGQYSDDYVIAVPGDSYGFSVEFAAGPIEVTKKNRLTIGDGVTFDGQNTLILTNANIKKISISANHNLTSGLSIYLIGDNTIGSQASDGLVNQSASANMPLTFDTSDVEPGTLALSYSDQPLVGFTPSYLNNLISTYDDHTLRIAPGLKPVVDHSGEVANFDGDDGDGLGKDIEGIAGTVESPVAVSAIVNNIHYNLGTDDGFVQDGDDKLVALNTTHDEDDIPEDAVPGTPEFNVQGVLSMLIPAGDGKITIVAKTEGDGEPVIKMGKNLIPQAAPPIVDDHMLRYTFQYAVLKATFAHIFNKVKTPATSRHRAPGKKMPNTIGIKSVSVSARRVASAPPPSMSPKALTKEMVAAAKEENHIAVSDNDVTSIASDAFVGQSDITYVDLSGTSITGVEIAAAKYELGDATVLLLPAGNTTAENTKNVVIGGVCEDLLLDDSKNFEIPSDFTAVKVAQKREYTADKNSTICLPYALDETQASALGTFYEPTAIASGTVTMTSVTKTEANVPYMLKAKGTKVSAEMVEVKKPTGALAGTETRFVGTYSGTTLSHTDTKQYYCFTTDGTFIHVKTDDVHVKPFRAYIALDAALGRSLDIDFGDGTTGIKNLKVGVEDNVYYDLQGRRVLYPKKGIYILNGKKVIIK